MNVIQASMAIFYSEVFLRAHPTFFTKVATEFHLNKQINLPAFP